MDKDYNDEWKDFACIHTSMCTKCTPNTKEKMLNGTMVVVYQQPILGLSLRPHWIHINFWISKILIFAKSCKEFSTEEVKPEKLPWSQGEIKGTGDVSIPTDTTTNAHLSLFMKQWQECSHARHFLLITQIIPSAYDIPYTLMCCWLITNTTLNSILVTLEFSHEERGLVVF